MGRIGLEAAEKRKDVPPQYTATQEKLPEHFAAAVVPVREESRAPVAAVTIKDSEIVDDADAPEVVEAVVETGLELEPDELAPAPAAIVTPIAEILAAEQEAVSAGEVAEKHLVESLLQVGLKVEAGDHNDNTVGAGYIRRTRNGQENEDSPQARQKRNSDFQAQMMMTSAQVAADMARLQELGKVVDTERQNMARIEEKYLSAEERALQPGESEADRDARVQAALQGKVARGEMSQREYDEWLAARDRKEAALQEAAEINARLNNDLRAKQERVNEIQQRMMSLRNADLELERISRIQDERARNEALQQFLQRNPQIAAAADADNDGVVRLDEARAEVQKGQVEAEEEMAPVQAALDESKAAVKEMNFKLEAMQATQQTAQPVNEAESYAETDLMGFEDETPSTPVTAPAQGNRPSFG